jgi:hypothetical protein
MRTVILLVGVLLATAAARAAELDVSHCRFPEVPAVPDGTQANEAEMGQAGGAVREFVAGIQTSLQCLTDVEKSLGDEITDEQQAQLVAIYNNGVDQMNAVAGQYNAAVRAYKER